MTAGSQDQALKRTDSRRSRARRSGTVAAGTDVLERTHTGGAAQPRSGGLGGALVASLLLHLTAISFVYSTIKVRDLRSDELFPIRLIELSRAEKPPPIQTVQATEPVREPQPPAARRALRSEIVTPAIPPPQTAKAPDPPAIRQTPAAKTEASPPSATPVEALSAPLKQDPPEAAQSAPAAPPDAETRPAVPWSLRGGGGGSEAGGGSESGSGAVALVPGTGAGTGGGGTAPSGLGRGSGAPGFPSEASPIRTNREATPVQTVRAHYPPMALRAGLESDVTLRIEVDVEGKVTNAEIVESGGAGFDEEALKAVKQSRFEPARRDGFRVPAEFTFVYRFRLRR